MSLKKVLLTAAALLGVSALPAAADYWYHNGSLMYLAEYNDGSVTIEYVEPRAGLREIGVGEGTILFQGRLFSDGTMEGTAFVFKSQCQPASYQVEGTYSFERRIALYGYAPVRSKRSCAVLGDTVNHNSELLFTYAFGEGG